MTNREESTRHGAGGGRSSNDASPAAEARVDADRGGRAPSEAAPAGDRLTPAQCGGSEPDFALPVRVLVVDDSAFARKAVREMLSRSHAIDVVGTARDGEEALWMVEELKPDIITCDLRMPRLDGVAFVRLQMARKPLPILILSASPEDADQVMAALNAGAIDFVRKPTALATEELLGIRSELLDKVKSAGRAPIEAIAAAAARGRADHAAASAPIRRASQAKATTATETPTKVDLVVIGISTGGPQALRQLLPQIPGSFPVPIAIVLHMPVGYTAPFAEKLAEISQIRVAEARDGDVLEPGLAVLAPAGRHLLVRRNPAGVLVAQLSLQPLEKLHRPSADVLFQSAAEVLHERVLGVVMTGMGDDGKQGAAWIKAQGGIVLTEAQSTCVIYGMPRSVDEAGLSDGTVPLHRMAEAISNHL